MTVTERPDETTASPGARYWHRSLHDYAAMTASGPGGREGGSAEPARFARHGSLPRYPLPEPAGELGAISGAFGSAAGPDGPAAAPTAAFHSALLHYSCGVLRTEFGPTARWPYHRAAPSARCFAPVEAYLWTPGHEGLPAGVHAYDPAHHALVRLRPGDHRSVLGKALGADIEDALGVLILSTVFWRTAFRYGDYAYRLCAQETGLVAGNVMMVAGTLGAEAHLHHQFLDGTLDRLLGTEGPQESIAAVLPLYPRRAEGPRRVRRSAATHAEPALSARLGPPPGRPATAPTGLHGLAELTAADGAARLTSTAAFSLLPAGTPPPAPPRAPVAAPEGGAELADCLRRRTSGSPAFKPARRPLPLAALLRTVGPVLAPWVSDAVPDGDAPPVTVHLWAVDVSGLADGIHRVTADGLHPVGPAGGVHASQLGTEAANIDYRSVGAVVFLSAPREDAQAAFGDRGFRVLHHEAGVVAQRLCVLSAAEGLAARIHNGYAARTVSRALGLPPGHEPLFQIALGTPGPDERYLMPVPRLSPPAHGPGRPGLHPGGEPVQNEVHCA
ncbi:SagB family peptide dehydrogenase [Streptomyces xanthophaeus]